MFDHQFVYFGSQDNLIYSAAGALPSLYSNMSFVFLLQVFPLCLLAGNFIQEFLYICPVLIYGYLWSADKQSTNWEPRWQNLMAIIFPWKVLGRKFSLSEDVLDFC